MNFSEHVRVKGIARLAQVAPAAEWQVSKIPLADRMGGKTVRISVELVELACKKENPPRARRSLCVDGAGLPGRVPM